MLVAQLAGGAFPRPVTEDLAARLLELSGAQIEQVTIDAFCIGQLRDRLRQ